MSELDDLVAIDGVLMAGRFGRDWSIAEHKTKGLYLENLAATEMAQWFCAAITMMLSSMAHAIDAMSQTYVFGNRVAGSRLDRAYQGKREPDHRTSE